MKSFVNYFRLKNQDESNVFQRYKMIISTRHKKDDNKTTHAYKIH